MKYETTTYFVEKEYDDVKGFTIINAKDGEYHIAEKWLKEDGGVWLDYWIPESQLVERHTDQNCEPKGKLTDDQFEAVCEAVGWYTEDEADKATA